MTSTTFGVDECFESVCPCRSSAVDVQSGVALKLPTHRMVRRDVEKGIKKV